MSAIQVFQNSQFGEVRVATTENNEPLFCLADICKILDIQTGAPKNRLNEKGISLINTPTSSGNQNMIFVDESNFYKAVFQSRKPEAEAFTDWVTSEVLPSIRKHGVYMTPKAMEPEEMLLQSVQLMIEQKKRISNIEKKVEQIEARTMTRPDYYTIVGYATKNGSADSVARVMGYASANEMLGDDIILDALNKYMQETGRKFPVCNKILQ